MKKILFITRALDVGGVENALFDLVKLLSADGYDCTVFTVLKDGEWTGRFTDAGIRVLNAWSNAPEPDNIIKKATRWLHRRRIDRSFKNGGKDMLKLGGINSRDYDLAVVYHQGKWCPLAGTALDCPTIFYIHGDISKFKSLADNIKPSLEKADNIDRIICVSNVARDSFLSVYPDLTDKTVAVLNPIDGQRIRELSVEKLPVALPEKRYICAVGRLSEEKGFVRLVRIHKRLLDKGIDHDLVIVGEGKERDAIEQAINEKKVSVSVFLTGNLDNPYSTIIGSRALVVSSFHEGFGLVAMEALLLDIPVVSSARSVEEVFWGYKCGIITDVDDESLEAGIEKMLTDDEFYKHAKEAAIERGKELDGRLMVKKVEKIYETVISEYNSRREIK